MLQGRAPNWLVPDARLLVFAKAPIPGKVKTRLTPYLSMQSAADLQQRLVRHTLALACKMRICPVQLWCFPTVEHEFFVNCTKDFPISLHTQNGHDLGERMAFAFTDALKENNLALLIGCDSPTLSANDLKQALSALKSGSDVVLGPAEDGGYVLIGFRHQMVGALFADMPWGTNQVLSKTRSRIFEHQLKWHELPERFHIDRPEDLTRLAGTLLNKHVLIAFQDLLDKNQSNPKLFN